MTAAHVLQVEARVGPLDFELSALRLEYQERERADLARCRRLHSLWERWKLERNTSIRDFLRTAFPDFEMREGTAYAHCYAGAALNAGLSATRIAHLEPFGWALMAGGKTPADLCTLIEEKGEEEARLILRKERSRKASEGTTVRRLPESGAQALDALAERLQSHPDAPVADTERRGLLIRMLDALPPPVFNVVATMASTGEATLDSLTQALREYQPDFFEAMKQGGCAFPGCGTHTGIELHHLAIGEAHRRGNDVLLPLCRHHHAPDGAHDSAHGMTRWAFYELWGGEVAFWMAVTLRYAQAAQVLRGRQA